MATERSMGELPTAAPTPPLAHASIPCTIRGRWLPFTIGPAIAMVLVALTVLAIRSQPTASADGFLVLGVACAISTLIPLVLRWGETIHLFDDHLIYRSAARERHEVAYAAVRSIGIETARTRAIVPRTVYGLRFSAGPSRPTTIIPMTSFRSADLRAVVEVVASHAPQAALDSAVLLLRRGEWKP